MRVVLVMNAKFLTRCVICVAKLTRFAYLSHVKSTLVA